jgi:hypothetical protein
MIAKVNGLIDRGNESAVRQGMTGSWFPGDDRGRTKAFSRLTFKIINGKRPDF